MVDEALPKKPRTQGAPQAAEVPQWANASEQDSDSRARPGRKVVQFFRNPEELSEAAKTELHRLGISEEHFL